MNDAPDGVYKRLWDVMELLKEIRDLLVEIRCVMPPHLMPEIGRRTVTDPVQSLPPFSPTIWDFPNLR